MNNELSLSLSLGDHQLNKFAEEYNSTKEGKVHPRIKRVLCKVKQYAAAGCDDQ